jgi:hypothetical protein
MRIISTTRFGPLSAVRGGPLHCYKINLNSYFHALFLNIVYVVVNGPSLLSRDRLVVVESVSTGCWA